MVQRWIISIVLLFASNAYALGLGEIQVSSNLGEPLKAKIALHKLTDADTQDMKVRLASLEEYKENNLQYPEGISFKFQIVNEPGANPFISITTLRSVDEPFLSLLIKFSSLTGKIVKAYTFLIDPSPDLINSPATAQPITNIQQAEPTELKTVKAESVAAINPDEAKQAEIEKPVVRGAKRKKRISDMTSTSLPDSQLSTESKKSKDESHGKKTKLFGKLSLSLSTSLSISRNDPNQPVSPASTSDALQEELIVKEKTLRELNAQIAEMQAVIKSLHARLNLQASSSISNADAIDQNAVASHTESAVIEAKPIKPKGSVHTVVTPVAEPGSFSVLFNHYWQKAAAGLALLLLGAGGVIWYRKRKLGEGWTYGTFEDISDSDNVAGQEKTADVAAAKLKVDEQPVKASEQPVKTGDQPAKASEQPVKASEQPVKTGDQPAKVSEQPVKAGEKSMKVPAYKEQKTEFSAPPEYDLLEEADIYLRFGHDKLAEEVLREAIKINPKNPHSYLTLLGIYETRGDVKEFATLARQLKDLGDEIDWKKAVEMGRRLDPENPLYLIVVK